MHNAHSRHLRPDYVYVACVSRPATSAGRSPGSVARFPAVECHRTAQRNDPSDARPTAPAARAIGARNTVVRQGRSWSDNTGRGRVPNRLRGRGFRGGGKTALVLGAGGSARAVVWALRREGVRETRSSSQRLPRTLARAKLHDCASLRDHSTTLCSRSSSARRPRRDCTRSASTARARPPIAIGETPKSCSSTTSSTADGRRLVRAARRRGARAVDGLDMLLEAGTPRVRIWTAARAARGMARASADALRVAV